jgi:hypothetical protein
MKTRKFKGGYIEKIDDKWTIIGSNKNPTVNEYRRLELIELDKLALDSKSTNSNTVLAGNEMERKYDEMCDESTKPTVEIEDTKKNIRSIIDLRYQENIRMFKHDETLEQKGIRKGHEYRLKLWRDKYKIIRQIYFNHYGEDIDDELTFLSSEKTTLVEKKRYLNEQLDLINTNISVIKTEFKTINELDEESIKSKLMFQFNIKVFPEGKITSEWIKNLEGELNREQTERKRDLEQLMEDVESQLNEVEVEITTPLKTPQKPRELEEGEDLLSSMGAEELSPVKKTNEDKDEIALKEGRLLAEKEHREQIVSELFELEIKQVIRTSLREEFDKNKSNTKILNVLMRLMKDEKQDNIKMIKLKELCDTETLQELKKRITSEIKIIKGYNEAYVELDKDLKLVYASLNPDDKRIIYLILEFKDRRDDILARLKSDGNTFILEKYEDIDRIYERMEENRVILNESTDDRYVDYLGMIERIEVNLSKLSGGKRKKKTRKRKKY